MTDLDRYEEELDAELRVMTSKQLRQYARDNALVGSLGGATTKRELRREIVGQMRHRAYLRNLAEEGRL